MVRSDAICSLNMATRVEFLSISSTVEVEVASALCSAHASISDRTLALSDADSLSTSLSTSSLVTYWDLR